MPASPWLRFFIAAIDNIGMPLTCGAAGARSAALIKPRLAVWLLAGASAIAAAQGAAPPQAAASSSAAVSAPMQAQPTVGRIERFENFASRHVAPRHIDVWLPADYSASKRYSVVYMHDGQNLFDARLSYSKESWKADVAVDRQVRARRISDTIIVGI